MRIESVSSLNLGSIQTLVFAGGGNRCWWQAGAVAHWQERGWALPPTLIGTSAGAAVAAACLSQRVTMALDGCIRLFDGNPRIFDWRGLARLKLSFAHQRVYPAWLSSFIDETGFDGLRLASSRLRVAFTRPARLLGLGGSLAAGTLAYMIDRYLANRLHPRLPRWLGLRYEFLDLQQCGDLAEAKNLLISAAAAPPFLSAQRIDGRHAIDGGYADNAPLPQQNAAEKSSTLVLLTRHYPKLPTLFRFNERHYWQPSQRIPVSTWDCTTRATVRDAFALGQQDALASRTHFVLP
jgi:predicted acylesterase/phospholipase RssA